MTTYYEMLGVRVGAHPAEIDLAYKTLSQTPGLDIEAQLELGMAHSTLLHPLRRPEYDQTLSAQIAPVAQQSYVSERSAVIHRHEYYAPAANNVLTGFAAWYILAFGVTSLIGFVALLF